MKRRDFITLLGGAAATWPMTAGAQQSKVPVIGYLSIAATAAIAPRRAAFRRALSEAGYVEGRNVAVEYRADDRLDRMPELAGDLVRREVSVIVAYGVPATTAAKAATATIPIIFQMGVDPVSFGFVKSFNRPGSNLTGIATLGVELGPKHLELLHELIPAATLIGLLVNPANPSSQTATRELKAAAEKLGIDLHIVQVRNEADFAPAFAALRDLKAGGLVISNEGLLIGRSEQLAGLALRDKLPAIHVSSTFAAAGGLASYGARTSDTDRLVARYIDRILKGEKAADLPVIQPTSFGLVINLNTAKALGLTVPPTLLATADDVIE
jgi:putative tryptophan/tyrosine transport system substrate-binding protein